MAHKIRYGTEGKCGLLPEWWREQSAEAKAFYLQRQKKYNHMRPCPENRGWWVVKTDCDYCKYAVFTNEKALLRGNSEGPDKGR